MNRKYLPHMYDVIERWVPDRAIRSALLLDLFDSPGSKSNKGFREVIDQLMMEHNRRAPPLLIPEPVELLIRKFCADCKMWRLVPEDALVCPVCREKALFTA